MNFLSPSWRIVHRQVLHPRIGGLEKMVYGDMSDVRLRWSIDEMEGGQQRRKLTLMRFGLLGCILRDVGTVRSLIHFRFEVSINSASVSHLLSSPLCCIFTCHFTCHPHSLGYYRANTLRSGIHRRSWLSQKFFIDIHKGNIRISMEVGRFAVYLNRGCEVWLVSMDSMRLRGHFLCSEQNCNMSKEEVMYLRLKPLTELRNLSPWERR